MQAGSAGHFGLSFPTNSPNAVLLASKIRLQICNSIYMDLLQGPLRAKGPAHTRGFLGSKEVLWQEEIPLLESCKNLSESHKRLLKLTLCISSECLHLEQNSEIRRKSQIITIFLRPILCEAGTFTSISLRCSQNTPQTPESYYPHCSGFSKQSTL